MRILNILHLPWLAGTERAYINLTRIFSKHHDVSCVIPFNAQAKEELQALAGVAIFENNKTFKNYGKWDWFAKRYFKKLIRTQKIELVVVHNGGMVKLLRSVCTQLNIPLLALNHGTNPKKTAQADYAFALTTTMLNNIVSGGLSEEKIFIIPNYIQLEKNPLEAHNTIPTIGFLGRFAPQKGADILLDALQILRKKDIAFQAIFAGDGPLQEALFAKTEALKLNDFVRFTGWLKDKKHFFQSIDIFCLPSRDEAFGIVLLEAMNHRKAIVSTNCEGPIDVFVNEKNGLLIEKENPIALANALERLLTNTHFRNQIAHAGYQTIIDTYDEKIVGQKIEKALGVIQKNLTLKTLKKSDKDNELHKYDSLKAFLDEMNK